MLLYIHRSASITGFGSPLHLRHEDESQLTTMLDVAKHAGVALSTVSYALNGLRPISEETRQRIFASMEELGYHPHLLARGLASKRSHILSLLFPASERGLGFTELEFVTSATNAARENGYNLVLWTSEMGDPNELRQLIQQGLVDGVVVMEVRMNDERVNLLRQAGFPFSMIGRCADTNGISYADMDFEQIIQQMVGYLRSLGHTRIGYLNQSQAIFDAGYGPVVRTQAGFDSIMQSDGLKGIAQFCRSNPRAGHEAFNSMLAQCPDMTALITMNERSIPGVMQAIADRGWRIPDDFSLAVIVSSAPVAEMVIPPLTALESPSAELGRLGVELLIQQLETQEQEAPQVLLPCRMIVRGSTAPCRRNPVA